MEKTVRNLRYSKILVAFSSCHDDKLRTTRIFPGCISYDKIFSVTKEHRHLFIFARINGNNKVFTAFHRFITSKEARG